MNKLVQEFRDMLGLYVKLADELTRISDVGNSEEDPQAFIQSILNNRSSLAEIQELNKRLALLYGAWKDKEAKLSLSVNNEIRGIVDNVWEQMHVLEDLCSLGVRQIEARRKQLADDLMNVGKESRYLEMLNPIKENHPKFIDSSC